MTDQEQPDPSGPREPGELSGAEEARIRALLAQARHDEPMPEAVVSRLNRVLADLAGEPADVGATVVPLSVRRRRATRMLVAAAAVVVAGVGAGQVLGDRGGSADSAAGDRFGSRASSGPLPAEGNSLTSGSAGSGAGSSQPQAGAPYDLGDSLQIRPRHFAADSRAVRRRYASESDSQELTPSPAPAAVCSPGSWGPGRYVPVQYGATPAYLVLRRPSGDTQVADLFVCGGSDPMRSVTLPAP